MGRSSLLRSATKHVLLIDQNLACPVTLRLRLDQFAGSLPLLMPVEVGQDYKSVDFLEWSHCCRCGRWDYADKRLVAPKKAVSTPRPADVRPADVVEEIQLVVVAAVAVVVVVAAEFVVRSIVVGWRRLYDRQQYYLGRMRCCYCVEAAEVMAKKLALGPRQPLVNFAKKLVTNRAVAELTFLIVTSALMSVEPPLEMHSHLIVCIRSFPRSISHQHYCSDLCVDFCSPFFNCFLSQKVVQVS
jgi:hypothetical protein